MNDNLKIWTAVVQPPPWALKTIGGGRLKGKTDINPQWRYHAMTELFGPCGKGWWYTIDRQWLEPGPTEEVAAFVNITLYTEECDKGIPATGGSMFVAQEKNGLYVSDEAYKMALTDALSVALKYLGVAAKIYYGAEATKYSAVGDAGAGTKKQAPPDAPARNAPTETEALVDESRKFDIAWLGVMEDIGEDDADNIAALKRHFIKTTTEKSDKFLAMSDSLNGMSSKEIAKLRAMLVKGREKVADYCKGDWREEACPSTCAGCAAILSPAEKQKSAMVKLPKGYCESCRPDAMVAFMAEKKEGA